MKPLTLLAFLLTTLTTTTHAANTRSKTTNPSNPSKNAVLLSSTKALTLHSDRRTTSRRGSPIPQLTCSGPRDICALYTIDTLRCVNEGAGYNENDVQWSCRADLPEEFKLGATEVSCEGYESSEDPFVLKGSCGVEYRLLLTERGEDKYGKGGRKNVWGSGGESSGWFGGSGRGKDSKVPNSEAWGEKESNVPGTIFMLIFVAVAGIILYNLAKACFSDEARERRRRAPRRPRGPGSGGAGGGGFDDGDDNDPPPPYDDYSPPPAKKSARTYNSSAGSNTRTAGAESWRPGFWSGAAAGAAGAGAGAYYANRRTQAAQTQPRPVETRQGGGGWFGNGTGGSGGTRNSSSSSGSPSYSSTRYESTGFGGTSRR